MFYFLHNGDNTQLGLVEIPSIVIVSHMCNTYKCLILVTGLCVYGETDHISIAE